MTESDADREKNFLSGLISNFFAYTRFIFVVHFKVIINGVQRSGEKVC